MATETTAKKSWVQKTDNVCGGDACIRNTRIPVWVLAGYRQLDKDDSWILQAYPSLTPDDVKAAWEYVTAHPEEIEQAIRENEEGEESFVE